MSYFPPEPESEDCLYLNIWAPAQTKGERCPVMVWFHGGGFNLGSGSLPLYSGEGLARKGVILVTLNYRLGRLGFLAHPELTEESECGASGNYGLLDQLAALRWIQRNIAEFGGNPDCVTIFGQSAGALSVSYFMASPFAKGLFHRAIGQSGAAFGPVDRTSGSSDANQGLPDAERSIMELGRRIGAASIPELRNRTPYEIQTARIGDGFKPGGGYERVRPMNGRGRGAFDNAFPVIDGHVLPDTVRSIFARGAHNDAPLLTGLNLHESSHTMQAPPTVQGYVEDVRQQYGDLAEQFLQFYAVGADEECKKTGGFAIGDRIFTWQNWSWANAQARNGKSPVFFYQFTHVPPQPEGMAYSDSSRDKPRAYHGGEIPYIFRSFAARDWPWRQVDHELSDALSDYWINFARTGNPNGGGRTTWPQVEPDHPQALFLGAEIKAGAAPNREKMKFWDEFYSRQPTCFAEYLTRYASAA